MPEKQLLTKPDITITPSDTVELASALAHKFPPRPLSSSWNIEMATGWAFAKEGDFYRAITCFKKALFLLDLDAAAAAISDEEKNLIKIEASTGIVSNYLFHKKYDHVIDSWDRLGTHLNLQGRREAKWLLIMMVEAFSAHARNESRAVDLAAMLPPDDPDRTSLLCYLAIRSRSLIPLLQIPKESGGAHASGLEDLFARWQARRKNPALASGLNFILPGSGYAYLNQWSTAGTSLGINALFIGATAEFFAAHQPMAALIALGLEFGWWAGGAAGARLAAMEYNHQIWLQMAQQYMRSQELYPEAILWKNLQ